LPRPDNDERPDETGEQQAVGHDPGAEPLDGLVAFESRLGPVADEVLGATDARHDRIARVDTLATSNAFELQAFANVDPGGARDHASFAVDAVARGARSRPRLAVGTGFSATPII